MTGVDDFVCLYFHHLHYISSFVLEAIFSFYIIAKGKLTNQTNSTSVKFIFLPYHSIHHVSNLVCTILYPYYYLVLFCIFLLLCVHLYKFLHQLYRAGTTYYISTQNELFVPTLLYENIDIQPIRL